MAYNEALAQRIRTFLASQPGVKVEEKKMFRGLAFLVNGKMCVNVSGNDLMCRFDPCLQTEAAQKNGYRTMIMKGREYKGYAYVEEAGYQTNKDLEYWLLLCLNFNSKAKSSKKK